jgi:hypothetical protein
MRKLVAALGWSTGGLAVYVFRAWEIEQSWRRANPNGMGLLEDYVSSALGLWVEVLACFVVVGALASLLPPPAPVTRLERLAWAFAPVSLFQAWVLPRALNFAASGGLDDVLLLAGVAGLSLVLMWGLTAALKRASAFEVGLTLAGIAAAANLAFPLLGGHEVDLVTAASAMAWKAGLGLSAMTLVAQRIRR